MGTYIDAHGDFVVDDGPACMHYVDRHDGGPGRRPIPRASKREVAALLAECRRLGGTAAAARAAGLQAGQLRKLAAGSWVPTQKTAQSYLEKLTAAGRQTGGLV